MDQDHTNTRNSGERPSGLSDAMQDEPCVSSTPGILRPASVPALSVRVQQVLQQADVEAKLASHPCLAVEHVLLALCRSGITAASLTLSRLGLSLSELCPTPPYASSRTTGMTNASTAIGVDVQDALAAAVEQAQRMGHHCVGTEHLLIGLLSERQHREGADALSHILDRLLLEVERRTPGRDEAVAWPTYGDHYELFTISVMA